MNKLTTLTQDQYRFLLEQIPAIVYTATLEHDGISFLYVSPQVESLVGIHPVDWVNNSGQFIRQIHPDDRERIQSEHAVLYRTHDSFRAEYRLLTPDGHTLWFRDEATVVRGPDGVSFLLQGVLLDITDQKRLEDELFRWDQETHTLTSHLPDIIARLDSRGRLVYLNRWFETTREVVPEWYLGKTPGELGLPDAVSMLWDKAIQRVKDNKTSSVIEFSFTSYESQKFFESRLIPEWGPLGDVESILIVTRDLTEKKQAEVLLRDSEERFRQLAESIADVFWLVDSQAQRFLYVSPAYEKSWGSSSQELYNNPEGWLSAVHPEDRMKVERSFVPKTRRRNIGYRISNITQRW